MRKSGTKGKGDPKFQLALGGRLKELREKVGWSQIDLAAHSGVSESQISVIENGHESPTLNTIKSIATSLGLTPAQFLEFEFAYKLNFNFGTKTPKRKKPGATEMINGLVDADFFSVTRSVNDVIQQCLKKYNTNLRSSECSGALLQLVRKKTLQKVKTSNNTNGYKNK